MGKLTYLFNTSLDAYVETPDRSLDWTVVDDELHGFFNDQSRRLDASLYGRRLWQTMSPHWQTADQNPESNETEREFARIWQRTPKFVFSTTLESVEGNARLVQGDVGEVLAEIRREFDGELEVGGPTLAAQFLQRGLVDAIEIVVHPVVLGAGRPFFPPLESPLPLRLTQTRRFGTGAMFLAYEVVRD